MLPGCTVRSTILQYIPPYTSRLSLPVGCRKEFHCFTVATPRPPCKRDKKGTNSPTSHQYLPQNLADRLSPFAFAAVACAAHYCTDKLAVNSNPAMARSHAMDRMPTEIAILQEPTPYGAYIP